MAEDAKFSICGSPLPNEFQYSYDASWSNELLAPWQGFLKMVKEPSVRCSPLVLEAGADALGQLTGGALNTFSKGITDGIGVPVDVGSILKSGVSGATNPLE